MIILPLSFCFCDGNQRLYTIAYNVHQALYFCCDTQEGESNYDAMLTMKITDLELQGKPFAPEIAPAPTSSFYSKIKNITQPTTLILFLN